MKKWKAGFYSRLSKDDDNFGSESMSIRNQIDFMTDWAEEHDDVEVVDIYTDDGFTGTNFDRPGYQSMMLDINLGIINCVIVKDLSRLGRNTSKVGELKDEIFPSKNVRFIAINDNVDTMGGVDNNDLSDFKLVFNEYYVKDISKKTKTAYRSRARRGDYVGPLAPYGYVKSDNDYHKLVIDEEAASVVKRIFIDYSNGKSGRQIADELNREGILSPMNYRLQKECKPLKSCCWSSNSVLQIINNEVYYGDMVQHKREKVSYKLSTRRVVAPEERIVVRNTHPAIIGEDIRSLIRKRKEDAKQTRNRKRKDGTKLEIKFSGLLICSDCGNKLAATTKNNRRCYRCVRYNNSGDTACSSHLIYEDVLLNYVKQEIWQLVKQFETEKEGFVNRMLINMNYERQSEVVNAKLSLIDTNRRINEIEASMVDLFEQKQSKIISSKMFAIISNKYDAELETLLQSQREYDMIINRNNADKAYVIDWLNALREIKVSNVYDRKSLSRIIEAIYISEVGAQNRFQIKYKIGFINDEHFDLKTA